MKFNFRKIASVIASAVMLGSTAGFALAANYPAPLVSGGAADGAIVVTSRTHAGAISDFDAAISVQSALQSQVSSSSSTTTTTTSGGDSVNLATSSTKLFMNSNLSQARSVITSQHLPTLLVDGTAEDNSGTQYKYTQKIIPGVYPRVITFGKSGESIDPVMMLDVGYQATTPVYNYTLTMQKNLNATSSTVVGISKLKIMGQEYTIGANTDMGASPAVLYLYGAGTPVTVKGGETKTVTVDGVDHTVTVVTTSSSTAATIEVDGLRKDVTKGSAYKFSGDIEVYIKSIVNPVVQGDPRDVEVLVGAQTLHLVSGQNVRYGAEDTAILGTNVYIGTSSAALSSLTISQGAASSTGDYLQAGQSYTDRVFEAVDLKFAGLIPELNSTSRDAVIIDGDNSANVYVEFTSALKTDASKRISFGHDTDGIGDSALTIVRTADSNNNSIIVREGDAAKVNEYLVVNSNDEGRILQVKALPTGTSSTDYVQLDDIVSGETFKFTTGYKNYTESAQTVGGGEYYVSVDTNYTDTAMSRVCLTWGASSTATATSCNSSHIDKRTGVGDATTLFPRIRLKNGNWMAILSETSLDLGESYVLPGLYTKSDYDAGISFGNQSMNDTGGDATTRENDNGKKFGAVNYTLSVDHHNSTAILWAVDTDNDGAATGAGSVEECNFNKTNGPAILIEEEKTDAATNGHAICIPLTRVGTSNIVPGPNQPYFTDRTSESMNVLASDSYKKQAVSVYGTFTEQNTASGTAYKATIKYPDEQMYAEVLLTQPGVTVTPGTSTSGGGVISIVKDTEVDTVSGKNLLVIGGSCINAVARKIVDNGATSPICAADFTAKTQVGAGQYIIKAVISPYNSAKTAILVAGYEAEETKLAVAKLKENHATDAGTSSIYPQTTA